MNKTFNNEPIVLKSVTPDELIEPVNYTSPSNGCINAKIFNFGPINNKSGKISNKPAIKVITTITLTAIAILTAKFLF